MPDAVHDAKLDPYAFRVYAFLCRWANDEGRSFWSRAKIAPACDMSPAQLGRALVTLKTAGWITWEQRRAADGGWTTSLYTVAYLAPPLGSTRVKVVAGREVEGTASPQVGPCLCQRQALVSTRDTKVVNLLGSKGLALGPDLPRVGNRRGPREGSERVSGRGPERGSERRPPNETDWNLPDDSHFESIGADLAANRAADPARAEGKGSRPPILLLPLPPSLEEERDKTSGTDPGAGQSLDIASRASATVQR